ncbi:hypothetical protein V5799_010067 [Amblyomma americanum]|uniref:Uncharacterized protein n=1 Tax=Amblyomma americanum TaxID=6943 RepID=A0AAQ4F8P1_AMBAM
MAAARSALEHCGKAKNDVVFGGLFDKRWPRKICGGYFAVVNLPNCGIGRRKLCVRDSSRVIAFAGCGTSCQRFERLSEFVCLSRGLAQWDEI